MVGTRCVIAGSVILLAATTCHQRGQIEDFSGGPGNLFVDISQVDVSSKIIEEEQEGNQQTRNHFHDSLAVERAGRLRIEIAVCRADPGEEESAAQISPQALQPLQLTLVITLLQLEQVHHHDVVVVLIGPVEGGFARALTRKASLEVENLEHLFRC